VDGTVSVKPGKRTESLDDVAQWQYRGNLCITHALVCLMKAHHTKSLGDLGVLKVQCNLFEQGYIPCIPLTEHAPYDLVACDESGCKRIQVKTRSLSTTGTISVRFQSSWAGKNGTHMVDWKKDSLDLVAVYCPETDACYYFDHTRFGRTVTLRVKTSKNNQAKKIHLANDYLRVP